VPESKPKKGLARLVAWLRGRPQHRDPLPAAGEPIAGFAGIWVLSDEAHITNIAVRRSHQRRGIGELLLITLFDLARDLKASFMTLEVRASNTTAQSLYRKYGFVEVGVRRGYYLDNKEDAIIMSTEKLNSASFRARLDQLKEDLAKKLGR
jgi:ribosomal-protein-alanine N-acetyltransferase